MTKKTKSTPAKNKNTKKTASSRVITTKKTTSKKVAKSATKRSNSAGKTAQRATTSRKPVQTSLRSLLNKFDHSELDYNRKNVKSVLTQSEQGKRVLSRAKVSPAKFLERSEVQTFIAEWTRNAKLKMNRVEAFERALRIAEIESQS